MEKIISNATAVAVPTLMTRYMMKMSGQHGAAALNTSLKSLGFGDMKRGIVVIGGIVVLTDRATNLALDRLARLIIRQLEREGKEQEKICDVIEKMPVSSGLKLKLKDELNSEIGGAMNEEV